MKTSLVVLLIKSSDYENNEHSENDEFASLLTSHKITNIRIPPIDFVYSNQTLLNQQILQHCDRYWALAVTSPRAAKAVRNVFEQNKDSPLIAAWDTKRFFAVGPASVNSMPYPYKTISPTNDRNVHGLVNECILKEFLEHKNENQNQNKQLQVLFPCGDLAVDNLPKMLSQMAIPCQPCVIYKTIPKTDFEVEFRKKVAPWLSQGVHFCVAFFSPSCFKNSIRAVECSLEFENSTFIAIGKQTQTTISSHLSSESESKSKNEIECESNCKNKKLLVCLQPTPQGLLDVVNKLDEQLLSK